MRILKLSFIIIACVISQIGISQMVQKVGKGPFLLKGGTIHPITSAPYQGDLLIEGDRISAVGSDVSTFAQVTTINCTGKHLYPGFIDAGTHLGLGEIGAVSLTNDFREIGDIIPQMQALTAVNPNSVAIPVTRVNGVTTVFTYPTGGNMPGTGAVIDLIGYTPDQMYAGAKAVILDFPSSGKRGRWDRRSDEEVEKAYTKAIEKIDDIWEKLELYAKIDSSAKAQSKQVENYQPEMEALLPVYRKETKLFVEVNKAGDIEKAIEWLKSKNVDAVLTGVKEGYRVTKKIKAANLPVITGPILSTPARNSDKYDAAYTNAAEMMKAGILVAIRTDDTENVRNLPFNAGFAATYGMGQEEALKAITINTAKIFGLDNKYGSLEKGKVANVLITDGDPFEMKTTIEHLFIRGLKVPMESRHTLLYEEFLDRSPGLEKNK